jgi:imidazole glycerol-phosphate synthase subunit HisF
VVVAIDAKREREPANDSERASEAGGHDADASARERAERFVVYSRSGSTKAHREAVEWAREAADRGAGEILLTSIDRDGTRSGFDCELTAAVSEAVSIPVIASGGAGNFAHFVDVFTAGRADAALAASIFHFSEHAVADLKQHLQAAGIPVRL